MATVLNGALIGQVFNSFNGWVEAFDSLKRGQISGVRRYHYEGKKPPGYNKNPKTTGSDYWFIAYNVRHFFIYHIFYSYSDDF